MKDLKEKPFVILIDYELPPHDPDTTCGFTQPFPFSIENAKKVSNACMAQLQKVVNENSEQISASAS